MTLWDLPTDKTGLYFSYFDQQKATINYTTITGEALADVATGTLAFKAAGALRTCFNIAITDTTTGEVFRDNLNGVLT